MSTGLSMRTNAGNTPVTPQSNSKRSSVKKLFSPRSKKKEAQEFAEQRLAVLSSEFGEFVTQLQTELDGVRAELAAAKQRAAELEADNKALVDALDEFRQGAAEKDAKLERIERELNEERERQHNAFFKNFVCGQTHYGTQY